MRICQPAESRLFAGALVIIFALALPLVSLAKITSGMVLVVFTLINLALIRIKRREPVPDGVSPVPMAVPVAGVLASGFILLVSI